MGLFTRKKREELDEDIVELPELPESKRVAFLPRERIPDVPPGLPKIETNTLPILPNSEMWERFNQEAIKEAITESEPLINRPLQPKRTIQQIPTREIEERKTLEIPMHMLPKTNKLTKKVEPIFIRLDKFQITNNIFEEIKNKISEIEELLKKTHEIKTKEEQELAEWEREIQIIKSRIDLIDKNIFNKLDEF